MKIVINRCYGGFNLSAKALAEVYRRGGKVSAVPVAEYYSGDVDGLRDNLERWRHPRRTDSDLVAFSPDETLVLKHFAGTRQDGELIAVVEELGDAASGSCSKLIVVEIPDDVDFEIEDYDGYEQIAEKHRTWP